MKKLTAAFAVLFLTGLFVIDATPASAGVDMAVEKQDGGVLRVEVTRSAWGPFWDRIDSVVFECTPGCAPDAQTFTLPEDFYERSYIVGGREVHVLPDGSMVQFYEVAGEEVDSVIDHLSRIVAIHCNDNGCIGIDLGDDDPIYANKTRIAAVAIVVGVRVVKPKWLPKWMTGRSSNGSGSQPPVSSVIPTPAPTGIPGGLN
ncbi:MAG: hypothetical protein OQJ98_01865 [Candidatus Pacebacteria bacterium]|nr:hypothetical protein [Candidatus Paceibacterota bacterium]